MARSTPNAPEPLLTSKQVADILGVSVAFLARDRWAGAKIPFIKFGSRSVRYRAVDLENFIKANRVESMSRRPAKEA